MTKSTAVACAITEREPLPLLFLRQDLDEARDALVKGLIERKHKWYSDPDSVLLAKQNAEYFEPLKNIWLKNAKDAIGQRHSELIALRFRQSPDKKSVVLETGELLFELISTYCLVSEALDSISVHGSQTWLPAGVSDGETTEEYSARLGGSLKSHLGRLTGDALLRIDIEAGDSLRHATPLDRPNQPILSPAAVDEPHLSAKARPADRMIVARRNTIMEVSRKGLRGRDYCLALDKVGLSTPIKWQKNEKCPKSYDAAFMLQDIDERKKWRQRIADEKYKATHSLTRNKRVP